MGGLVLAGCSLSGGAVPTITPTAVATSTPPPTPAPLIYDYAPLNPHFNAMGYPTLGNDTAPVSVVEYSSYDSAASRLAHQDIFPSLLPRIALGEVNYVWIPLYGTGSAPNGEGAALAAWCAGEQGAYWQYHDLLFAYQDLHSEQAYTSTLLIELLLQLGLDRTQWESCLTSGRPQAVLTAAQAEASALAVYSGTPTLLVNGNYVLNDGISLNTIIDQVVERTLNATEVPAELVFEPLVGQSLPLPVSLTLPSGWAQVMSDTLVIPDFDAIRTLPFVTWKGTVEGGTGSIVLLWGFPSIVSGSLTELGTLPTNTLWVDGLRLLRLAVTESGCNVGTDLERTYPLAGSNGTGTQWSAVDCPTTADTRGWFVGLQHENINFIFYTYIEPIDPAGMTPSEQVARDQIQAILDSVRFLPLADFMP